MTEIAKEKVKGTKTFPRRRVKVKIPGNIKVMSMMDDILIRNGKTNRSFLRAVGCAIYDSEMNRRKAMHELNRANTGEEE
ncbi:MAG: hypothetical protein QXN55_00330 [Candidatus Nitrosotenuis sp.]